MSNYSKQQLTTILAFYYFNRNKITDTNLNRFTERFNKVYKTDENAQNISYTIVQFQSLNPSYTTSPIAIDDKRFADLWIFYIENDRTDLLKKEYSKFQNNEIVDTLIDGGDEMLSSYVESNFCNFIYSFENDKPKNKYDDSKNATTRIRDANVTFNALKLANYKCEFNQNHVLFERKNANVNYTEGHHLIPLAFQDDFDFNLDIEANVVSLCSNCHNNLHYGKGYKVILSKLFNDRKDRLKKCGIFIDYEKLEKMYD